MQESTFVARWSVVGTEIPTILTFIRDYFNTHPDAECYFYFSRNDSEVFDEIMVNKDTVIKVLDSFVIFVNPMESHKDGTKWICKPIPTKINRLEYLVSMEFNEVA